MTDRRTATMRGRDGGGLGFWGTPSSESWGIFQINTPRCSTIDVVGMVSAVVRHLATDRPLPPAVQASPCRLGYCCCYTCGRGEMRQYELRFFHPRTSDFDTRRVLRRVLLRPPMASQRHRMRVGEAGTAITMRKSFLRGRVAFRSSKENDR